MFLRFLPHQNYARLVFTYRARNLLELLPHLLAEAFSAVETNLYQINGKLSKVNELLFQYKEHFPKELGSAPPPFSLLLLKEKTFPSLHKPLRPGKIYIEPSLRDEVEDLLKKANIWFSLLPYGNLLELDFPATVDSKLYFPMKDLFLVPHEKRCFFCGSYSHPTPSCPGLTEREPTRIFYHMLTLSPWTLAEKLNQALVEEKEDEVSLKSFFCRYFFNFPAFLPILFYRFNEINSFIQIPLELSTPVRGGDLGLGVEDLMAGRIEQAEKRFQEVEEGDFRRELGLAMAKILKEDFTKAIYFLELALTFTKNTFLIGYLFYLKGAIYFQLGDRSLAEENFQNSLKEDPTCYPALFFLSLCHYLMEESFEKVTPYFHHPYVLYLAYLEPLFIRLEKELEETLDNIFLSFKEEAISRLKEAEDRFHSLKEVMPEEIAKDYQERLKSLSQDINQGGLALVERASKATLELGLELSGYVIGRTKKIKKELDSLYVLYQKLSDFWQKYPYKLEDKAFGQDLKISGDLIQRMERRLRRSDLTKELKFLEIEIKKLQDLINNLLNLQKELEKKWQFRTRLYGFLKRFSLAEGFNLVFHSIFLFLPETFIPHFPSLTSFLASSLLITILCLISVFISDNRII